MNIPTFAVNRSFMSIKVKCFSILFFFFIISCKKNESEPARAGVEIIYPLPYIPVYPGSWWRYVNGLGDSIQTTLISDFQEHSYSDITQSGAQTSVVKIPFWNGYPMYGYSYPRKINLDDNGMTLVPFLTENEGDQWITSIYDSSF